MALSKKIELLTPPTFLPQIESRIVRRGKSLLFYKRSSPSDAQRSYMPRSQEKLACALVQNDYDQKTIPAIEAEIKELKVFIKAYKTKSSDSVYKKLASTRRQIVTPLTLDDEAYAAA